MVEPSFVRRYIDIQNPHEKHILNINTANQMQIFELDKFDSRSNRGR